jgi:cysteinyl-tRNA synthetase
MFCYTAHYRSPLSFSFEGAAAAEHGLLNLRKAISSLNKSHGNDGDDVNKSHQTNMDGINPEKYRPAAIAAPLQGMGINKVSNENVNRVFEPFMDALCDDLNVPRAVAALWEGLRDDSLTIAEKLAFVEEVDKILGLDLLKPVDDDRTTISEEIDGFKVSISADAAIPPELKSAILQKAVLRKKSRAAKDFKAADAIRDQFAAAGVAVKDLPGGATECVVGDIGRAAGALVLS